MQSIPTEKQSYSIMHLKQLTLSASNLSEPLSYFLDLAHKDILSDAKSHKRIEMEKLNPQDEFLAVIKAVEMQASQFMRKKIRIATQEFFEISEHHFFHGFCVSPEIFTPITVFYFSDIQTGLIALSETGFKTEMFRFVLAKESMLKNAH